MSKNPILIGVDWGTTAFRAYLICNKGAVIDHIDTHEGILSVTNGDFETVFNKRLSGWLKDYPNIPILLSGMITSRNGWFETDYLNVPASIEDIAEKVTLLEEKNGRKLHFITGLMVNEHNEAPDIMRGEETELIGQLCSSQNDGLYLLPGTHSKWAQVNGQSITSFKTFMTGELFSMLKKHSILAKLIDQEKPSDDAFAKGVKWRLKKPITLLHNLFSVRTFPLFEQIDAEHIAEYLSGLLIADEILGAFDQLDKQSTVTVIGRDELATRYFKALQVIGIKATVVDQSMVAIGHYEIAKMRGLI